MDIVKIEQLNIIPQDDIGRHLYQEHKKALEILSGEKNALKDLSEDDLEYLLRQFQVTADFIPASEGFMKNVKRRFPDKQANFTIQNFLTWHFIDAVLLTYFKDIERFNKFKECAVTDIDMIFVNALEKMLSCISEYSMDEIRYMYFIDTVPKLLPYYHFYKTKKEDTEKILDKITGSRNGANEVPIEALYASQLVFHYNVLMKMHIQNVLQKRKSKYGASPYKMNEDYYGNIVYNGFRGLYKPLEKGSIEVKKIDDIDDISYYFENRRNAYNTLSISDELRGAYINNKLVGVIGIKEVGITNIHVDGDYRLKGVATALIESVLNDMPFIGIVPFGDALGFVKRVSKYSKKLNKGIITLETLNGKLFKKRDISNLKIVDGSELPMEIVSDQFKRYLDENYRDKTLSVKNAIIDNLVVGYIIYDKKERNIAVLEVDADYRQCGIGTKLLESVVDYNIWCTDIAKTGILFWFGKGVVDGYKVYLCNSEKRLKKFAKEKGIDTKAIPKMHLS